MKVTRYCVQIFTTRGRPPEAWQYREPEPALIAGELASRRAMAVGVYEVQGEPLQDLWKEPRLIASYGPLPD